MDNWWDFKSDEDRKRYIKQTIDRINEYPELKVDHVEIAKDNPKGEKGYLNDKLSELMSECVVKGGIAASWKKNGCKRFNNLEKTILKEMNESSDAIQADFHRFAGQLESFLLIYFQYQNLRKLFAKTKRQEGGDLMIYMNIAKMEKQVEFSLKGLVDLGIENKKDWNKKEFVAICYYIYGARNIKKEAYVIEGTPFDILKAALAKYFYREVPSAGLNKATAYWRDLPPIKRKKIEKLFN